MGKQGSLNYWSSSVIAVLIFLLFSVSVLFTGCGSSSSLKPARPDTNKGTVKSSAPTEALVYVDEAMLRKPYAIIGGTVENTSASKLEEVFVELELQRRSDGAKERRLVKVMPEVLKPGERGSYALKILSDEWSDSRIVALRSDATQTEIDFKTSPGHRRPPERLISPTPLIRVEKAQRPQRKSGEEEFINTPDNPVAVP